jgi:putative transposase
LKGILNSIAEKKQWESLAVEVMPDHVHLFVSVPPTIAPSEVVKTFKGQSGRHFLMAHPEFTDSRYDNSLWAPSYFVASAGDVSSETIKAYIEGQYD